MSVNPIKKAWILGALADRKWHTQYELIILASRIVKPEVASRRFYQQSLAQNPNDIPVDVAICRGMRDFVQCVLTHLYRGGLVEYRGVKGLDSREFRYIGWHCWNCGCVRTCVRPDSGLCENCQQYHPFDTSD